MEHLESSRIFCSIPFIVRGGCIAITFTLTILASLVGPLSYSILKLGWNKLWKWRILNKFVKKYIFQNVQWKFSLFVTILTNHPVRFSWKIVYCGTKGINCSDFLRNNHVCYCNTCTLIFGSFGDTNFSCIWKCTLFPKHRFVAGQQFKILQHIYTF